MTTVTDGWRVGDVVRLPADQTVWEVDSVYRRQGEVVELILGRSDANTTDDGARWARGTVRAVSPDRVTRVKHWYERTLYGLDEESRWGEPA
ncbi:hypothetical protein FDA94_28715 [Herbidospora galbida]|uniref:Uncharacterized protein n=1 Tax=Herbidospora galbida TaxID=2575442 RepID=A0A4U3M982_9ACTN|nr:hypothetical protein [Herbidospora galbida]TKK84614.1 hypothetical protein FDA94_28715 [Herbidospora galbida]